MSPPLANELIGHTARANFALAFLVIRQVLLEVIAVPTQVDESTLPLLEKRMPAVRIFGKAQAASPFLARPQRSQVIPADKRGHAVQGFVVGVPLIVFEVTRRRASVRLGVTADEILDSFPDVWPILLKERIVR